MDSSSRGSDKRLGKTQCAMCKLQLRTTQPENQIMAPLLEIRLKMSMRAFAHTAVDYGGPFITAQGRGRRREKRYLCLFTCLNTKTVHSEMGYGLGTDTFSNAFYRISNRRGLPETLLSDNGANFVGSHKELKNLVEELDYNKIRRSLTNNEVK